MVRRRASANATRLTAIAPAMTNASDGSQFPARSRNPRTFAGFAMPETIKPESEHQTRDKGEERCHRWSDAYHVADDENGQEAGRHERKRRGQRARRRRDSPQTPWPLVHPPAKRVPMPTSSPATITTG